MRIRTVTGIAVTLFAVALHASIASAQFAHDVSPALEQLRGLEGRWEGTTDRGDPEAVVTYEVVGAGSAVVETLFPNTRRVMTTVYHDDHEGNLVMTHYCTAGNQPLLAMVETTEDTIYFELSPNDTAIEFETENHAHALTLTIHDDGTLEHDWLNWGMGEPAAKRNIKLTRVR